MFDQAVDSGRLACTGQHFNLSGTGDFALQSGRCERIDLPQLQLPVEGVRLQKKQRIISAFKKGQLALRVVDPLEESVYLNQVGRDPRPAYVVAEGVAVGMRSWSDPTIAIVDPEPLALYKCNATTWSLVSENKGLDELKVKCMSDMESLWEKMYEQQHAMNWEVYQPATSGHLTPRGDYSLPKFQPSFSTEHSVLPHSELLMVSYRKEQIACYWVCSKSSEKITTTLEKKRQLAQSLGLEDLPVALYSEESGTVDVWFEDELLPSSDAFEQLQQGEAQLDKYADSLLIDPVAFRQFLTLLSWPQRIDLIHALRKNYVVPAEGLSKNRELVHILTTPEAYSAEKLRTLVKQGVNPTFRVYYRGVYNSLPALLVKTEVKRRGKEARSCGDHPEDDEISARALGLFRELVCCGAGAEKLMESDTGAVEEELLFDGSQIPHLFDSCIAAGFMPRHHLLSNWLCYMAFPEGPGKICFFDTLFGWPECSFETIQNHLKALLVDPFQQNYSKCKDYLQYLMMFFYYGADPRPFLDLLLEKTREYSKESDLRQKYGGWSYSDMSGDRTPEEYVEYIRQLWENRICHPFFTEWPKKVQQAKADLEELRKGMEPHSDMATAARLDDSAERQLQCLVDAFRKPPALALCEDSEQAIFQILQHYYRRPGPERVLAFLGQEQFPVIWKSAHSCGHVLRVRNTVCWYVDLLEQFGLARFDNEEKELLALAAIYHDAAAEDVGKCDEESRSACYFRRDLAGRFSHELLDRVGEALERKEDDILKKDEHDLNESLRNCIRVLRFADRMDYIRGSTVGSDFPAWHSRLEDCLTFDVDLLDIPPQEKAQFSSDPVQKTAFQRALEACMHGAVDLASVTGGCDDERQQKGYPPRHGLAASGGKVERAFERTSRPVTRMDCFVDDNVRRMIAAQADIVCCSDSEHKTCKADTRRGVTYGIHNSRYDLGQIQLPSDMTLVEKMQCEHDFELLRRETCEELQREIGRLRRDGIAMNPGTLTQETLRSAEAVKVLSKRGVKTVESKRQRGFDKLGDPRWESVWVPVRKKGLAK